MCMTVCLSMGGVSIVNGVGHLLALRVNEIWRSKRGDENGCNVIKSNLHEGSEHLRYVYNTDSIIIPSKLHDDCNSKGELR